MASNTVPLAQSPLIWALEAVRLPTVNGLRPFVPYSYQATLLADRSPRLLVLKARQVGITTTIAIRAAHEALFLPQSLSLIVSKTQGDAANVLRMVYGILHSLEDPPELAKANAYEAVLGNGSRIVSQPATAKAGRGYTATSVVLDEFAYAEYDSRIYRAVSPTLSRGGRLTIISTPDGQGNLFYRLWQGLEGGEWSKHRIHWRDCPVFSDAWAERKRGELTSADWASEYECDFVVSGGSAFSPDDVDAMREGWLGLQPPHPGRCYVTAWDIGRRKDPTVGVTLDITEVPYQVVAYERLLRAPFAQTQAAIDARAGRYGGATLVEATGIGDPVIEGLACRVTPFQTTATSKADMLTRLVRAVEQGEVKAGVEQLLGELKGYQWDDSRIVQDSVIALAIALHGARSSGPPPDWTPSEEAEEAAKPILAGIWEQQF